jgi:hypothetical protein
MCLLLVGLILRSVSVRELDGVLSWTRAAKVVERAVRWTVCALLCRPYMLRSTAGYQAADPGLLSHGVTVSFALTSVCRPGLGCLGVSGFGSQRVVAWWWRSLVSRLYPPTKRGVICCAVLCCCRSWWQWQ